MKGAPERAGAPGEGRPPGSGHVRAARARELDRIGALYAELVRHHRGEAGFTLATGGEDAAREHLARALRSRDACVLVCEGPGGIAGFAVVRVLARPPLFAERERGEIEALYVRPDARRRGAGRALASAALRWLEARGIRRVALQVAAGNREGAAFWRALGFVPSMDVLERLL